MFTVGALPPGRGGMEQGTHTAGQHSPASSAGVQHAFLCFFVGGCTKGCLPARYQAIPGACFIALMVFMVGSCRPSVACTTGPRAKVLPSARLWWVPRGLAAVAFFPHVDMLLFPPSAAPCCHSPSLLCRSRPLLSLATANSWMLHQLDTEPLLVRVVGDTLVTGHLGGDLRFWVAADPVRPAEGGGDSVHKSSVVCLEVCVVCALCPDARAPAPNPYREQCNRCGNFDGSGILRAYLVC